MTIRDIIEEYKPKFKAIPTEIETVQKFMSQRDLTDSVEEKASLLAQMNIELAKNKTDTEKLLSETQWKLEDLQKPLPVK